MNDTRTYVIGLISDTHGLVRPDVHSALKGVALILHAGDVGGDGNGDEILNELEKIAPVRAVRGNVDPSDNPRIVESLDTQIGGIRIHVSHGHEVGPPTPAKLFARYNADVIVYGHTHKQMITRNGARWAVNPGAAGQQRFDLLPSVAKMLITDGSIAIEIVSLAP